MTDSLRRLAGGREVEKLPGPQARTSSPRQRGHYLPMIPGLLFLAAIALYPTIYSLFMSLHRWRLTTGGEPEFVGLANYSLILTDEGDIGQLSMQLINAGFSVSFSPLMPKEYAHVE